MKKLTPNQREAVRDKLRGRCAYCGDPLGKLWHVDHRHPVRRDLDKALADKLGVEKGADDLSNMLPSCTRCNQRKVGCPSRSSAARYTWPPSAPWRSAPT